MAFFFSFLLYISDIVYIIYIAIKCYLNLIQLSNRDKYIKYYIVLNNLLTNLSTNYGSFHIIKVNKMTTFHNHEGELFL